MTLSTECGDFFSSSSSSSESACEPFIQRYSSECAQIRVDFSPSCQFSRITSSLNNVDKVCRDVVTLLTEIVQCCDENLSPDLAMRSRQFFSSLYENIMSVPVPCVDDAKPALQIVDGPIGAGKTSFLNGFSCSENAQIVCTEPVDWWLQNFFVTYLVDDAVDAVRRVRDDVLKWFYEWTEHAHIRETAPHFGLAFQLLVLFTRNVKFCSTLCEFAKNSPTGQLPPTIFLERSAQADRRTFVLLGVEMGTISLGDLDFYDLCANEVAKDFDKCYASKTWILLLSSRLSNDEFVSVLCDRIRERGRKSEKAMSRDYLTKLVVNYQKFAQELQQQVSSQDTRKRDVVAFFFNERKYASDDDKNSSIFEHFKTFCDRSVKSFLATFFWWLRVSA